MGGEKGGGDNFKKKIGVAITIVDFWRWRKKVGVKKTNAPPPHRTFTTNSFGIEMDIA